MLITLAFFISYAASSSFITELSNVLPLRRRETSALLPLTAADSSFFFDVQITIGGQEFFVLADTGSSDLWVVGTGYRCFNGTDNQELPQSACNYSNATYNTSPTFRQIQNETLGVQYGAGIATGCMGTEDVTLGGVTLLSEGRKTSLADWFSTLDCLLREISETKDHYYDIHTEDDNNFTWTYLQSCADAAWSKCAEY